MASDSLALKLRVLRAERALTIEEAAKQAGVTPETISDAERGRRHPYLPTLRKLAAGYQVPVEELLELEDEVVTRPKVEAPPSSPVESGPEERREFIPINTEEREGFFATLLHVIRRVHRHEITPEEAESYLDGLLSSKEEFAMAAIATQILAGALEIDVVRGDDFVYPFSIEDVEKYGLALPLFSLLNRINLDEGRKLVVTSRPPQ